MKELYEIFEVFLIHSDNRDKEFLWIKEHADTEEAKLFEHYDDADITIKSLSLLHDQEQVLVYAVQVKDKPGTLSMDKCKELKIPKGPLLGELKQGKSVVVNGKTIDPAQVLGEPTPGPSFVLFECPTLGHMEQFKSHVLKGTFDSLQHLEFFVHITPEDIWSTEDYQQLLSLPLFRSIRHIVLNKANRNELSLLSSTISQVMLNKLNPDIFKLLVESTVSDYQLDSANTSRVPCVIRDCPVMFRYFLRKNIELKFNPTLCKLDASNPTYSEMFKSIPELSENGKQISRQASIESASSPNPLPNCLMLGTASCQPGILRNTTGIMMNLAEEQTLLLDCGEGTLMQLARYVGRARLAQHLASIKVVFISHIHADHNFGLIPLMKRRAEVLGARADPLVIVGPELFHTFLSSYRKLRPLPDFRYILCDALEWNQKTPKDVLQAKERMLAKLSLEDMVTVPVPHCQESYGVVFTWQGEKYVYSGDTAYSEAFDQVGQGCRLLIHEATMNDDLKDEAEHKRHSTISDAIKVGMQIKARHAILTHFSQRYAKVMSMARDEDKAKQNYYDKHVTLAYDFMCIPFAQLATTAAMKDTFDALFAQDLERQSVRSVKKAAKRKRLAEMENSDDEDMVV